MAACSGSVGGGGRFCLAPTPMAEHLRVIVRPNGDLHCQAVLSGDILIAPLHAIHRPSAPLFVVGSKAPCSRSPLIVKEYVPSADAAICAANDEGVELLRIASDISAGERVEVHGLAITGGKLTQVVHPTRVREVVRACRHIYEAGAGLLIGIQDVFVTFLDAPSTPGMSGGPILRVNTNELVGIVHGNASANSGAAVALHPGALVQRLQHRS